MTSFAPGDQWWKPNAIPSQSPTRIGVSSTPVINADPAVQILRQQGKPLTNAALDTFYQAASRTTPTTYHPPVVPVAKRSLGQTSGGGGGRGGGGGGGGGAKAAPQYSQAQLDWMAQLLARAKPGDVQAGPALDLPDYQGQFDPSIYNDLENRFGQAVGQSRTAADTAYSNLGNYLTSNYRNAFAQGPPQQQAPGMDSAAMARMMQAQGANPALANQQTEGWAAGQGAVSSLWGLLGANEDTNQRNRLNRVQTDRGTTNMAIDAAQLQGLTGIGLQRSQAQAAWQQQADQMRAQIAQQEAMQNWQRANQVSDLNASNRNSYTNAEMQALLGLLPDLKGTTLAMPSLDTIFGGAAA